MFVRVRQSTIAALARLWRYIRVLKEHSGGCGGRAKYYINNREALLLEQRTIGALGRMCWNNIIL